MNVLIINGQATLYGAEQTLLELVRVLDGVRVTVLSKSGGPLIERLARDGIATVIYDFGDASGRDEERHRTFIKRILDERQISLVHMNKPHLANLDFVRALRAATLARRIPLIAHVRSNELRYDEDQLQLLAAMDALIFVSHGLHREFHSQYGSAVWGGAPVETKMIYNGRTLEDYGYSARTRDWFRTRFGLRGDDFVIGMLGYLSPVKGQDRFLHLARRLSGNDSMKFVVVGGPLPEHPEYARAVDELIGPGPQ